MAARELGSAASPTACSKNGPGTVVIAPSRAGAELPTLRNSIIATGESGPAAVLRTSPASCGVVEPSQRPRPSAGSGSGGSRWI